MSDWPRYTDLWHETQEQRDARVAATDDLIRKCARFEIVSDGPNRWVLVDNESDDPHPVYCSEREALKALSQKS